MDPLSRKLQEKLQARRQSGLYRLRRTLTSPQQTSIAINGRELLSFCSNDYLGLANHPKVLEAFRDGLQRYGVGSGASHLVSGHSHPHEELEQALAAFTGRSRALLFSSGYMANLGVLTCLAGKQDQVFEDRLNHASLLDGGIFSGARFRRYPHLGYEQLQTMLEKTDSDSMKLIVSDGVFSMDGDTADLDKLVALGARYQAVLMVDDAHGFGVLGNHGGGLTEKSQEAGCDINEQNLQILVGTLGKSFGTAGAFVAGSDTLIESLVQFCRPYIYTTAMPPAVAAATLCSLQILQNETWRREHLQKLVSMFRAGCAELGLALTESSTPIQGVVLGSPDIAVQASRQLEEQGIMISAIRPPTVPEGSSRLRVTLCAEHTGQDIQRLLEALERVVAMQVQP